MENLHSREERISCNKTIKILSRRRFLPLSCEWNWIKIFLSALRVGRENQQTEKWFNFIAAELSPLFCFTLLMGYARVELKLKKLPIALQAMSSQFLQTCLHTRDLSRCNWIPQIKNRGKKNVNNTKQKKTAQKKRGNSQRCSRVEHKFHSCSSWKFPFPPLHINYDTREWEKERNKIRSRNLWFSLSFSFFGFCYFFGHFRHVAVASQHVCRRAGMKLKSWNRKELHTFVSGNFPAAPDRQLWSNSRTIGLKSLQCSPFWLRESFVLFSFGNDHPKMHIERVTAAIFLHREWNFRHSFVSQWIECKGEFNSWTGKTSISPHSVFTIFRELWAAALWLVCEKIAAISSALSMMDTFRSLNK